MANYKVDLPISDFFGLFKKGFPGKIPIFQPLLPFTTLQYKSRLMEDKYSKSSTIPVSIAIKRNTPGTTRQHWQCRCRLRCGLYCQIPMCKVPKVSLSWAPDNHLLPRSHGLVMVYGPRPQMQKSEKYVSNFIWPQTVMNRKPRAECSYVKTRLADYNPASWLWDEISKYMS